MTKRTVNGWSTVILLKIRFEKYTKVLYQHTSFVNFLFYQMIELNVSSRRFVKYLKKIDIKSKRELFYAWFGFNRCYVVADCWKKRIRSSIFSSNCFRCFLWSDFLWHSLSSRNRWSVSVSLSFRDARQRASLLVYTLFEDSRSSSSMRAITCFFLRNIFVWNIESFLPHPYWFECL